MKLTTALTLTLSLSAALVAGAAQASGDKPKKPSLSDVFASLPKAKLEIPKSATIPKSIPASEKVEGLYLETPPHFKSSGQAPSYAMVYASKEDAVARNSGQPAKSNPTCFMNAYPNYNSEINWSQSLGTSSSIQNYKAASYPGSYERGSVQLVRADRVIKEEAEKLTYEVKLAFVDAESMGARLLSKQTLELSLVDELPGKVKVWGARADDQVTFMVRRDKHELERHFFGPLMVTVNGRHDVSSSEGCPVVFSLKTGKGVANGAVVQLETLLGVSQPDEEDGEASDLEAQVPTKGFLNAAVGRKSRVAPPSFGGFGQREAKVRAMRIGVSSSWMSQDAQPVVSVSHGWAGRERTQPI